MQPKHLAIALWITALLILVGVFTRSWFTPDRGDGGVGLTGVEVCRGGRCQTASWDDLKRAPKDIGVFGWLGLVSGLGSAGLVAAVGGLVFAGRPVRIPLKVVSVVLGVTAFATTMFAMRVLGEMSRDVSLGFSGFLAVGGLLVAGGLVQKGVAPLTRAQAGGGALAPPGAGAAT